MDATRALADVLRARLTCDDVRAFVDWATGAGETRQDVADRLGLDRNTLARIMRDTGPLTDRWSRLVALLWAFEWLQAEELVARSAAGDEEAAQMFHGRPPRPPWMAPRAHTEDRR